MTSVANISGSPGQTVAAGSFMLNNTSSGAESVNSVTLTVSDPNLYSSLALTATVSGTPHTVTVSPPTSSTVFTFSPALSVPAGGSASFSLSATISTTPAMLERRRFEYATILDWPGAGGLGSLETGLGLLALVLMIVLPAVRRRTLILLALLMVLAASETGCGSNSSATVSLPTATATPKPSSSQTVTSVSATASGGGTVTFTGLPASLGKVSLQ